MNVRRVTVWAVCATTWLAPVRSSAQDLRTARDAWRAGRYQEAAAAYAALGEPGAPARAHRERAELLAELGRYAEAERVLVAALPEHGADLRRVLGDVVRMQGRLEEAVQHYRAAEGGDDDTLARLRLGEMAWLRGDRERAYEIFDSFIDLYNRGGRLDAEALMAVGEAVRRLAVRDPVLFQDALRAYDEAAEADPGHPGPALLAGHLFLDKYQAPEAHASFDEVLAANPEHPDALLGKAEVLTFDGDQGRAIELVRAALETNPKHVAARSFLARLHLKLEDYDEARAEVERALDVNPSSLDALSVLAGVHYLEGDTAAFERVRDRALQVSPRYPDLYNTVAELAVDTRKYHDAVKMAERAVALDSTSWWGLGLLGINQLRTGHIDEGIANVERAFEGDGGHNVWLFNTLTLTDTFDRYETVRTEHFELFLHGVEADLLAPYVSDVAERAFEALSARYGTEPPTPVRLELFRNQGDFSVRTLGMTGLGALGVSFGSVLVMDSPSAFEPGQFNWASVLWHELAHAFHLGMTEHRVPRWFSEGLAVHEQRLAQSRWGHKPSIGFLSAYSSGRLHPVSRLNEGFLRPDYPEQVPFSYLQASLVFQMIEDRQGKNAILAMLHGYRAGKDTETLFREVLGKGAEDVDDEFDAYMQARFGREMAALMTLADRPGPGASPQALVDHAAKHPGDVQARLAAGGALLNQGRLDEAEQHLRAALRLFPGYAGPGNAYELLARMHRERGETERAADALHALGERTETAYRAHVEEAALRGELGQTDEEIVALERAIEIFPFAVDTQTRLAALYERVGDHAGAVRARSAVLALDPVDRARALYRLALAHFRAGDAEEARSQVLRALEIAPTYDEALELLLRLRDGGSR